MKRIAVFIFVLCLLIMRLYPQSNYAIIANQSDNVLRSYGAILRFEIRDLDTQIPLENASIDLLGDNDREIALVQTNNRGIGIIIIKDIEGFPWSTKIRITKNNHRSYEEKLGRQDLKNSRRDKMIILLNSDNNWNGAPSPSDQEILQSVNTKNYKIYNSSMNVNYSGPGIYEYPIILEQIRNREYVNNPNPPVNEGQNLEGWREIKSGEFAIIKDYKKYTATGDMELRIKPSGVVSGYRLSLITTTVSLNGYSISSRDIDENGNITEEEPSYTQSEAIRIMNKFMSSH